MSHNRANALTCFFACSGFRRFKNERGKRLPRSRSASFRSPGARPRHAHPEWSYLALNGLEVQLASSYVSKTDNGIPVVERKFFKSNHLKVDIFCSGGLEPDFRVLFSWGISIRVETCGSERKQKCGKLWSIYVQNFYMFW